MAKTDQQEADFVTILSSELIAEIVEAYFNAELYKVAVKVVDLKPTESGYAFSLAFCSQQEKNRAAIEAVNRYYETGTALTEEEAQELQSLSGSKKAKRSKTGQFVATNGIKEQ